MLTVTIHFLALSVCSGVLLLPAALLPEENPLSIAQFDRIWKDNVGILVQAALG